jgi:hypothetical protein
VKDHVLLDSEKSLRTNETWLTDLAAFTIAIVQRYGERIPVRAARDLAQNQISAWKISNHQSRPMHSAIPSRKRNDDDFAGYRFDHASSSSGEFQSRPRTDSLSSAPLNPVFSSDSLESSGFIPLAAQSITAWNVVQHCFVNLDLIKHLRDPREILMWLLYQLSTLAEEAVQPEISSS